MAVLMSKLETATGTVRVTRMRHGDYAATCFTVRYKRFLGARKQQSDPLCDSNASKCVPEKQQVKELECPMEGNAVWPSAVPGHM